MLALIRKTTILGQYHEGGWVDLPNGDRVSPAVAGWASKGLILSTILPADPVPAGNRIQTTSVEMVDGSPKYVNAFVADLPQLEDYKAAFDDHLDAVAQQREYDNRVTIATYATSSNPEWAIEAQTFIAWRDNALASMFSQFAAVQAGGDAPTVEEFVSALPEIIWPE